MLGRAIRNSGNKTDFWSIYNYLPRETRSYVPMFVAVLYVMNDMDNFKIEEFDKISLPESDTILVSNSVNLTLLARQLNVKIETLQDPNPHIKRDIVPPYFKNCIINIPKSSTESFLVNRSEIMDSVSKINFVQPVYLARNTRKRTNYYAAVALPTFSVEGFKKITYVVKPGDLLMNIAALYNVSIPAIKAWNGMRGNVIWAGQRLLLWIKKETPAVVSEKKEGPLVITKQENKEMAMIENSKAQLKPAKIEEIETPKTENKNSKRN